MGGSAITFTSLQPLKRAILNLASTLFDRAFGRPSQSVEIVEDPQLAQLKQMITARAGSKGTSYEAELRLYLDNYADTVVPAIKEKLISELVN
jgi:hypothetical protein